MLCKGVNDPDGSCPLGQVANDVLLVPPPLALDVHLPGAVGALGRHVEEPAPGVVELLQIGGGVDISDGVTGFDVEPVGDVLTGGLFERLGFSEMDVVLEEDGYVEDFVENGDPAVVCCVVNGYFFRNVVSS